MRASRSIQSNNGVAKRDSHGGHINIAPDIIVEAPKNPVLNNEQDDRDRDDGNHNDDDDVHSSTMTTSHHLPRQFIASLSPRLHRTASATDKVPSPEAAPDNMRPRPTPPGYTSKKALEVRAAAEAIANTEAEHLASESAAQEEHLAMEAKHLTNEAERLAKAAAAAAQAEHLVGEAAAIITNNAQATTTISINNQDAAVVVTKTSLTARPPLISLPSNVNTEQDASARRRRTIIPTAAAAEAATEKAMKAQKAAETKAKKAAKTSVKRVAEGDVGPAKKKPRVSSTSKNLKPVARKSHKKN